MMIAGTREMMLHTRPAIAIPLPADFFDNATAPKITPIIAHGIEI
jgi:hypothetical protein